MDDEREIFNSKTGQPIDPPQQKSIPYRSPDIETIKAEEEKRFSEFLRENSDLIKGLCSAGVIVSFDPFLLCIDEYLVSQYYFKADVSGISSIKTVEKAWNAKQKLNRRLAAFQGPLAYTKDFYLAQISMLASVLKTDKRISVWLNRYISDLLLDFKEDIKHPPTTGDEALTLWAARNISRIGTVKRWLTVANVGNQGEVIEEFYRIGHFIPGEPIDSEDIKYLRKKPKRRK
ncbi:MAG TPA: hypothetical protein VI336_00300 [Candidatus Saccharimonadales bacterium]|nr:hypothetical protein [Candidatus Saccharimonadales bacterium]